MSFFKKLFGGGGADRPAAKVQPEEHAGFLIYPQPVKQAGGYRIGARIEKEVGGSLKTHELIRADIIADPQEAERMSVLKARQVIDEQGEALFG